MRGVGGSLLIAAGCLSAAAAVLHLASIVGGASWYRALGAPEAMARAAQRGSLTPAGIKLLIALLLAMWAAYAFSGAGLLRRLPLLRTGLVVISILYLVRGLALFPTLLLKPQLVDTFTFWSSLIVLAFGLTYAAGTAASWPALSAHRRADALA